MSRILEGPEGIALGVRRLSEALPVAFPTETVYGLGADALNPDAVAAVFALKRRPASNPLIVHVSGIAMARGVVKMWNDQADAIARAHWPGPVTIVLKKHDSIPGVVCAGGETVAVRCPAHPVALALIEAFGGPIVGPSANPSGRISPTCPEHVADGFSEHDLIVIDGGACHAGIESTVIDLTGDTACILRRGVLGIETLSNTLGGTKVIDRTRDLSQGCDSEPARSPGLIGAHYQPRTPCRLASTDEALGCENARIALIAWSTKEHPASGQIFPLSDSAHEYAAGLYRVMHMADACGADEIWIELPPIGAATEPNERAVFEAVLERLARATQSG